MTVDSLITDLRKPYARNNWENLLRGIFPSVKFIHPQKIEDDSEQVVDITHFGNIKLADEKVIALLEIQVAPEKRIIHNRVQFRNIAAKFIDLDRHHAVIAFYYSEKSKDYRLTFISKSTKLEEDGSLKQTETAKKRYTFILGPNEACKTAAYRLLELTTKAEKATRTAGALFSGVSLADVADAFSVDKLTKEFFNKYKDMYERMWKHIANETSYPKKIFGITGKETKEEQAKKAKEIRNFVKMLLGRIVFLHFLQKKGWMGVAADQKKWSGGNLFFMRDLFEHYPHKENFYSKCLTKLFFNTLNNPKRENDIFSITKTRVPFLNGGLFDEQHPETKVIDLPQQLFKELFEFFDQYNFTIDENSHDDLEVGIDPEMLGHIFENLLEENREKGTFYTPKEIVHYMCQESLIQYLRTHIPECTEDESPATKAVERLIRYSDKGDESAKNNFIVKNAKKIEDLLDNVKVCDPAIGSGAFPMGILQEILRAKNTLDLTLDRAKAKKEIIQNTIYGVDIEKGAVDIARLRFWLALIVDEDKPHPLPNLDYKIMQGDSLLESFEGIDLSKAAMFEEPVVTVLNPSLFTGFAEEPQLAFGFGKEKRSRIKKLMNEYFTIEDKEDKLKIHGEIDKIVREHIDKSLEGYQNQLLIQIAEIDLSVKRKKELKQKTDKEAKAIAKFEKQIDAKDVARRKLIEFEKTSERPYFLWHLYFGDVMNAGGFDIVIANPPYIRQELIKNLKPQLESVFTVFNSVSDIYTYFYEQSYNLLKRNGISTFITSNNWIRAGYGKKLRAFFKEKTFLESLVDFDNDQMFENAIVATNILIFKKGKPDRKHEISFYNKLPQSGGIPIKIKQDELEVESFSFQDEVTENLKRKLKTIGTPLKDWDIEINRGVTSGFNDAFYIDEKTRTELIKADKKNKAVIKPVLRGRDVRRYYLKGDGYMLFIPWHFPLHEDDDISGSSTKAEKAFKESYPDIYNHLLKFKNGLSKRNQAETGIRYEWYALQRCAATYFKDFDKEKIVWLVLSDKAAFAIDLEGNYTNDSTFILVGKHLKYLCAILNSKISEWYFDKIASSSGMGTNMWKKYKIEQLPVPDAGENEDEFDKLVNKIIDLKKQNLDSSKLENKIDAMVFRQYNLTEEEMVQVLDSFKDLSIKDKNQITNEYRNIKFGKFELEA